MEMPPIASHAPRGDQCTVYEACVAVANDHCLDSWDVDQFTIFLRSLDPNLSRRDATLLFSECAASTGESSECTSSAGESSVSVKDLFKFIFENDDQGCESPLHALGQTRCDADEIGFERNVILKRVLANNETADGVPPLGVSVQYLYEGLIDEMLAIGFSRDAKVFEVCEPVIMMRGKEDLDPVDGRPGTAYVDAGALYGYRAASTQMISYTWGYSVGDIVDSLFGWAQMSNLDPCKCFIWMCCLCVNQWRVREQSANGAAIAFEEFANVFGTRVKSIGSILAMMQPWYDPVNVSRVWCVYEMYTAVQHGDKCKLEVIMPPREQAFFTKALGDEDEGMKLWKVLAAIDVSQAKATVEQDKKNIMEAVNQGPGYHKLNEVVIERLQQWCMSVAEINTVRLCENSIKDTQSANALCTACSTTCSMMNKFGDFDRTLSLLNTCYETLQRESAANVSGVAKLLKIKGSIFNQRGSLAEALESYEAAREILQASDELKSVSGVELLKDLGILKSKQRDQQGALHVYQECYDILKSLGELNTPSGAKLLKNMGVAKGILKDNTGALACYIEAKQILVACDYLFSPNGAVLLKNMGVLKAIDQDPVGAMECYEEAWHIRRATGTFEHPDGALLLVNMARVKARNLDDPVSALQLYREAHRIYVQTNALGSREGKALLSEMVELEMKMSGEREDCSPRVHVYRGE